MVYYRENYTFPRIQRGSNVSRGSIFFQGVQRLFSIETHITCVFQGQGRSGPPIPSLDPHMPPHLASFLGNWSHRFLTILTLFTTLIHL